MSKSSISVGTRIRADKINAKWRHSAAEIIEVGRMLLDAKETLPHGDFEKMITTQLDFGPQTARKLMAVAGDKRVVDRAHVRALPDHWSTLYELTKLSDDEFDQALKDGTIRSDMERKDVPKKRKETPQGAVALDEGGGAPLTGAELSSPQDVREVEDGGVTEYNPEIPDAAMPVATAPVERPATNLRQRIAAVAVYIDPNDPMDRFANGLLMMMAASQEFSPREAAWAFPQEIPLRTDELSRVISFLCEFEEEFRNQPALAPG